MAFIYLHTTHTVLCIPMRICIRGIGCKSNRNASVLLNFWRENCVCKAHNANVYQLEYCCVYTRWMYQKSSATCVSASLYYIYEASEQESGIHTHIRTFNYFPRFIYTIKWYMHLNWHVYHFCTHTQLSFFVYLSGLYVVVSEPRSPGFVVYNIQTICILLHVPMQIKMC